ncbi:HutP family protein [Desulfofundulus thermosubterraneus]|uniref:Hut operon positive regulatory protein n=1 Tax=Desulfofundulus thermosubterraneus DSM 16057 TaxID=1121432 RepID=A0A1M6DZ46_9FIRM|nr:HutP family protein [Desulfofundulus thermosubterraneus]SHI78410.1 HutP protein [Desulfofundulus thermosubterraneus DSM 16057]
MQTIGRVAIKLAVAEREELPALLAEVERLGYRAVVGKVGSMTAEKVVAAVETAVQREQFLESGYRHVHSLYHAIIEVFYGVCRGQLELGQILRTVGLNFAVVRGPRMIPAEGNNDEWLDPEILIISTWRYQVRVMTSISRAVLNHALLYAKMYAAMSDIWGDNYGAGTHDDSHAHQSSEIHRGGTQP